ncbi:deoxyguanosinetriphosphate triphosphohydrolase-likeprotein [Vibrio cholerae]|nr:deoxyguanosinetriphosphate triphosphohydrolase-likeprotein [Vibrio cholerae]
MLLPPELRAINDCKTRLVTDYISGMSLVLMRCQPLSRALYASIN